MLFSPPFLHAKAFTEKLFTIVSFILCVPQEKMIVIIGKTGGLFNTTALAVNYIRFFHGASCMPPLEVDNQMLRTARDNIVRWMMQAVSLKAHT